MALVTVGAGPQFDDGTYVGTVKSVEAKEITPKSGAQAGQKVQIIEWKWDLADLTSGEAITDFDTGEDIIGRGTTSTASGPKSKMFAWLVALFGPQAVQPGVQFEAEDIVGGKALVSIVHDEGGYPTVDAVTAMPRGSSRARAAAPTVREQAAPAAEAEATDDDLPF